MEDGVTASCCWETAHHCLGSLLPHPDCCRNAKPRPAPRPVAGPRPAPEPSAARSHVWDAEVFRPWCEPGRYLRKKPGPRRSRRLAASSGAVVVTAGWLLGRSESWGQRVQVQLPPPPPEPLSPRTPLSWLCAGSAAQRPPLSSGTPPPVRGDWLSASMAPPLASPSAPGARAASQGSWLGESSCGSSAEPLP